MSCEVSLGLFALLDFLAADSKLEDPSFIMNTATVH